VSPKENPKFFKYRDFRSILAAEYELRKMRRSSYSLRAFARDLGINPITLTAVLNRRHGISRKVAEEIALNLGFDSERKQYFCDLVESAHARTSLEKAQARDRLKRFRGDLNEIVAEPTMLSHWYYAAVLEIINNDGASAKASQIAERLGISEQQVTDSIKYLKKSGLIAKSGIRRHTKATSSVPSKTIRDWHLQLLELSKKALERQPIEKRKYVSTVFAMEKSRVEEARKWLSRVHQEFLEEFVTSANADCVYTVAGQLFQLDDGANK
jgi:uncharacterized protein (TIGR02147 family)